jgi:hypothetical protein
MKELKILMLLMPIALYSAGQGTPKKSKIVVKKDTLSGYPTYPNTPPKKNNQVSANWVGSQALLEYTGSLSGMYAFNIGIQVAIDTTIGVRYEVTFENGTSVMSHVAIFYKFSSPYQTVLYNFRTHKSTVNKNGGSSDPDANVDIIGNATVDNYLCTHLQHGAGTDQVSDYWMSPNVPGFSKLINTLKTISPDLPALAFSGTIFNWGGLVKWTENFVAKGQTMHMELNLLEANTDITLPSSTFDLPSN